MARLSELASRSELVREGLSSALYVALVLYGALAVVPGHALPPDRQLVLGGLAASLGLIVLHWFSFTLAAEIVAEGASFTRLHSAEEGLAQVAGGLGAAGLGALAFLLFDGERAQRVALFALALIPALAGFALGRQRGYSAWASFGIAVVVVGIAWLATFLKVVLTK